MREKSESGRLTGLQQQASMGLSSCAMDRPTRQQPDCQVALAPAYAGHTAMHKLKPLT